MKKLLLLILVLNFLSALSQTDTTSYSKLDNLTPDELQQYYINEPEPPQFYKGPTVGDSVYQVLKPLSMPTETVYAPSLIRYGVGLAESEMPDTVNRINYRFKPKISLGVGTLGFTGDLYKKHKQKQILGRPAYDLGISQRLTRYLQLDFSVLFGKLGANEVLDYRHENFQSEIRAGGVNLIYDFGNFIPDKFTMRPYVSFGVLGFEFLSKTDLKDKNGNTYFYWSDGSIRDRAEGSAEAQNSVLLRRDYQYESDIRELNRDGFGKYPERAWSFPIGAGILMKVTDRVNVRMNFQYYLTTTDYIDGMTNKGLGVRKGTKANDKFTYTSVSFQYDLISKYREKSKISTIKNADLLAIDKEDSDKDGVPDLLDNCAGTPEGAKVDMKGCPLDEDNDGIPNYRDDELTTPPGAPVNDRGVAQNDEYWKNYYEKYLNDSTDMTAGTEVVGNIFANAEKENKNKKKKKGSDDIYTVELARYSGAIPTDELAFLLSIGDINSVTLDDGTTVVYTTGNYDKLSTAVKRRDEFRGFGNKSAGISKIKGKQIIQVSDDELEKLLKGELEDLMNIDVGAGSPGTETENFNPNDVVYRVQLGAFRNRISTSVFNTSAGAVLELKTGENIYRYVTKGYKTIENAASVRADLVIQGYSDAFVTAYRGGKRIPLSETNATVEDKTYKEDLSENKMFSSIDKNLVSFKIQLGPLKKRILEASMDEKVKELPNVEKQTTTTGSIRYTSGKFPTLQAAEDHLKAVQDYGITDAFLIATFKDEVISKQEAMELLK